MTDHDQPEHVSEDEIVPGISEETLSSKDGAAELREEMMQLTAHFENLRRDLLRDMTAAERRGIVTTVRALAPALDSLLLAQKNVSEKSEVYEGLKKTYDQFTQALERLGVVRIQCEGMYDPKFHEAMERVPGEAYTILEEASAGWMWKEGEHVIVPARVKVGSGEENDKVQSSNVK